MKIAVCFAGGLVLNASARADDVVLANNPYAPIVVRNVFGLSPTKPEDSATQTDPPPKITLNGIMSIFGRLQVLFKVTNPAKPGQPDKEDSYILSEGQRQDEIEVFQIDEKNSLVTFNNHGTVQKLSLAKASTPPVNTVVAAPGRPFPPLRFPPHGGENDGKMPSRIGSHSSSGPGAAQNRGPGHGSPVTAPASAGNSGQSGQPPQGVITDEEQAVLMEAQREVWKQQGNPAATTIPPTTLTPRNGAGGMPPMP